MYKIINIKGGNEIGSTENPRYIKKKDTGCYIQTDETNAQGIAYKGTAYNLQGRDGIDVVDTVFLLEVDGGIETDNNAAAIADCSAAIDDIVVAMLGV